MARCTTWVTHAMLATASSWVLVGCGGGGGTSPPPESSSVPIAVKTLSNRADFISNGDAYIEVVMPEGSTALGVTVDVDGADVTSNFAMRADGRMLGVVKGLKNGTNVVSAKGANGKGARLVISNHERGGPVFAGVQVEPWICATKDVSPTTLVVAGTGLSATVNTRSNGLDTDALDAKCNAPTKYIHYYQPKSKEGTACTFGTSGANPCFVEYDPSARPADDQIADFTNDRGVTAKRMLRLERGTIGRGIYQVLAYFDPAQPWDPWAPQTAWNGKLHWKFGASASGNRFQQQPGTSLFDANALAAGFMVANAQLTNHNDNNNELLAAENMMMIKEHIIDTYGEIRYTMADGGSGGSMMQTVISSVMPGLIQGLLTGISYPDAISTWIETRECGALTRYYETANGLNLNDAEKAAITGQPANYCSTWRNSFINPQDPKLANNCGAGFPASLVYDPILRPNGVRCGIHEMMIPILGTLIDVDRNVKPRLPYDNVGIQYGLKALQDGELTLEQFVQLNEGIGSYNADMLWSGGTAAAPTVPAARFRAVPDVFPQIYQSGLHSNAKNLAKVAIIDLRPERGADIHMTWRTWQARARLVNANGGHGNHVVRASSVSTGAALTRQAFDMMDRWLAAIESDRSGEQIESKVINNKPADVKDGCFASNGATEADLLNELPLDDAACPLAPTKSPRQIAGGPVAEDVYKCQLKPLSFSSPDYAGLVFDAVQQNRLRAVFPDGVCDWSKPGVGQTSDWTLLNFNSGPSGQAVGPAPASEAF